jgi:hypothetical protein
MDTPGPAFVATGAADPLTVHLMALPEADGWTLSRDLDLMELAISGMGMMDIARELDVKGGTVQARFDILTGLYTDDAGKKLRRFTREAVLDALQALTAQDAKTGAAT